MSPSDLPPEELGVTLANVVAEAARLRAGLEDLDGRITLLQQRIIQPGSTLSQSGAAAPLPTAACPAEPLANRLAVLAQRAPPLPPIARQPPPLPPMTQQPPPLPTQFGGAAVANARNIWSVPTRPPAEAKTPASSLEMKIGGTWLVRVGIVALLASLALLTSYLYQHVVPHLGPGGKVALLLAGAGALAGLGAWLERRAQATNPGLLNYARVLLGGGLAAVYYVLYAAHANPALLVITNAWVAGVVQLGWAAFMVWLADRRSSQTLATGAILLAYFASASNGIGTFTLFSNLALTVAAVYLLRRHRWMAFSFASLLATYGSYAFWHYASATNFANTGSGAAGGHWFEIEFLFLSLYWFLLTVAVFQPDAAPDPSATGEPATTARLPSYSKATFATLNNGAFFLLTNFLVDAAHPAWLWRHAAGFGAILIALGSAPRFISKRFASQQTPDAAGRLGSAWTLAPSTVGAYQLLGLVLFTLGLAVRFSGWNLALALTAESVVLQLAALEQARDAGRRLLPACALSVGFLGVLAVWLQLRLVAGAADTANPTFDMVALTTSAAVAAGMLFNAAWSRRALNRESINGGTAAAPATPAAKPDWLPALPVFFSLCTVVVIWLLLDAREVTGITVTIRPWALAIAALIVTAVAYPPRLAALAVFAQLLMLGGLIRWLETVVSTNNTVISQWSNIAIITAILALLYWWQCQTHFVWPLSLRTWLPQCTQLWLAASVVGVLFSWLAPHFTAPSRMALWSLLAVALLIGGWATRAWSLATMSQAFLLAATLLFINGFLDLLSPSSGMWQALAPVGAALVATGLMRVRWPMTKSLPPASAHADATSTRLPQWLAHPSIFYEVLTLLLASAWAFKYVAEPAQFAVLALFGATLFVAGARWKNSRWLLYSALPTTAGMLLFWSREFRSPRHAFWLDLLAAGLLFIQQWLGRRGDSLPPRAGIPAWAHHALMGSAVLTAWRWLTDFLALRGGGSFFLTAGWSFFAALVFAAGLARRERVYRWLGLGVLFVTLGRVAIFDLWQAEALHRILGLLALAVVLLALGFVYNRFGAKLREWL